MDGHCRGRQLKETHWAASGVPDHKEEAAPGPCRKQIALLYGACPALLEWQEPAGVPSSRSRVSPQPPYAHILPPLGAEQDTEAGGERECSSTA